MRIPANEIFGIDWTNLEQVKKLANKMGRGNYVIKVEGRPNYNITKYPDGPQHKGMKVQVIYTPGEE